jgi:hypothetical protein
MDYPYQIDGLSGIYKTNVLEQDIKLLIANNSNNSSNIDIAIDKLSLKGGRSETTINDLDKTRNIIKKRENTNKESEGISKKIKVNLQCKRCNIYGFDTCECIIRSLDCIYISGKRRKFIMT